MRERVGSSLIGGSCKPAGSGGLECRGGSASNAGLSKSDLEGVVGSAAPSADVPGAVVSRAGGVNGADPGCTSPCADVPRGCGSDLLREDGIEGVRAALGVLRVYSGGVETAHATAGENKRITDLLEVIESDVSKNRVGTTATAESAAVTGQVGSSSVHASAGESERIVGSFQLSESDFPSLNSSVLGLLVAHVVAPAGLGCVQGAVSVHFPGVNQALVPDCTTLQRGGASLAMFSQQAERAEDVEMGTLVILRLEKDAYERDAVLLGTQG